MHNVYSVCSCIHIHTHSHTNAAIRTQPCEHSAEHNIFAFICFWLTGNRHTLTIIMNFKIQTKMFHEPINRKSSITKIIFFFQTCKVEINIPIRNNTFFIYLWTSTIGANFTVFVHSTQTHFNNEISTELHSAQLCPTSSNK